VASLLIAGRRCDALGQEQLATLPLVGLLCSRKCPGDVILAIYDAIRLLRDAGIPIVGGFHSPMEQECLELLLRGKQPVVICRARHLDARPAPPIRKGIEEGRVLLLSPFPASVRRVTTSTAHERNVLVSNMATVLFVPHAEPGGDVEGQVQASLISGKPIFTLPSKSNEGLEALGARSVSPQNLSARIRATLDS